MTDSVEQVKAPKPEVCAGQCRHTSVLHVVKLTNVVTGSTDLGCAKVDCPCMKFQPSGKPNQDAR